MAKIDHRLDSMIIYSSEKEKEGENSKSYPVISSEAMDLGKVYKHFHFLLYLHGLSRKLVPKHFTVCSCL